MRMMPRAMPCQCTLRMWIAEMSELVRAQERLRLNRALKSEHNLYLACEDSPQTCFLLLNFLSQYSTLQNTYVAEDVDTD